MLFRSIKTEIMAVLVAVAVQTLGGLIRGHIISMLMRAVLGTLHLHLRHKATMVEMRIARLLEIQAAEAVAQVQQAVQGLDLLAALAEMVPLHLCLALV